MLTFSTVRAGKGLSFYSTIFRSRVVETSDRSVAEMVQALD